MSIASGDSFKLDGVGEAAAARRASFADFLSIRALPDFL